MNIISEYFRAKNFWSKNIKKRDKFPDSFGGFEKAFSRMPVYSRERHFFPRVSVLENLNPLKIPRHFGSNGEEQVRKIEALKACVQNSFSGDCSFLNIVGNPKDGGSFWDSLIGRGEGDTPIAICEHVTLLNFLMMGIRPVGYNEWLFPLVEYVREYRTGQLNNHLTWKALFIASSGLHLVSISLMEEAYFLFQQAVKEIRDDGSMPLELARDSKSSSYTRMNLEALIHLERIFNVREPKIRTALSDFDFCLSNHDEWKKKRGLKNQDHPQNLMSWGWVFMFDKPVDFSIAQESYVSHFTEAWKK